MLKINFLGDSITEGMLATSPDKSFVSVVGQVLNCEARNYGIGGTRIAKQKHPSAEPNWDLDFIGRAPKMNHDADFVFVFGGTNDYGHGDAPMGSKEDNTPYTFCGAINYLLDELLEHYRFDQIVFIMPIYRVNEDNPYGDGSALTPRAPLSVYRSAMEEVLKARKVQILDIKDDLGPADNKALFEDGLHPTNEGHRLIAELIVKYLKGKIK